MKQGSDRKIRVGVVGVGHLGRWHAEKYAAFENVDLVGVADVDSARAEEVAKNNGTVAYASHEALFGKVDAVSIATPTETHCAIGLDFISRGVDVLIEKPITIDTSEADRLIEAAEKAGRIVQVGHLERFNAAVVALNGRVVNPLFIESHRLSPFPYRSMDVDVILDLMIHDIDILLNLVNSEVESVDAVGIPVISDKVDIANARLRFANGCVANVTASRVSKAQVRKVRLFQHDAYVSIDYAAQHISITGVTPGVDGGFASLVDEGLEIEKTDSLREELKAFVDCSATGSTPLVSGRDGRRALRVAKRIQDSVEESMANFLAGGAGGAAGGAR